MPQLLRRHLAPTGSAVGSGVLLMLAFPPYSLWPAAVLGAAFLLALLWNASYPQAAWRGSVAGLAFFVPLLHWSGIFVGPVPWLLLASSQAAFVTLFALLAAAARRVLFPSRDFPHRLVWARATLYVVSLTSFWVATEALRTRLPWGGFPWGRLGFASVEVPWIALAGIGGVPLLSAWPVGLGAVLAMGCRWWWQRRGRGFRWLARWAAAGGAVLVSLALTPAAACLVHRTVNPAPPDTDHAVIAVIQGNVPQLGLDFNAQRQAVLTNHVNATLDLAKQVERGEQPQPDVVIWPENSSDIDPLTNPDAYAAISSAVNSIKAPVVIGALVDGPEDYISNSGIVWLPQSMPLGSMAGSGPSDRYVKRHPVPFAEYIPLRRIARWVSAEVDRVPRDFVAGQQVGFLPVPRANAQPIPLGDVICFEVGYDNLVRDVVQAGAGVVSVQTNNATFGFTPQTQQQLVMSQIRALEHQRPVVVAATSGVSAMIDSRGKLLHRSKVFRREIFVADISWHTRPSIATRWEFAIELLLSLIGGILVGGTLLRRRTDPSVKRPPATDRKRKA